MPQREEIVQQALGLPPEDRAFVAAALEHSLASEPEGPFPSSADFGSSWRSKEKRRLAADSRSRTSSC